MYIYLVQHGVAKTEEEDPNRGLADDGIRGARKVGAFLVGKTRPIRIYHSGKKRAEETAKILNEYIRAEVYEAQGLNPADDPLIWFEKLNKTVEDIMLVGHLPHLERLAGLLLAGNGAQNAISFKNAGVVCIRRGVDFKGYKVEWIITPELFR